MPDRPADPPEFDWLYGKNGPKPVPQSETEHTQVMPRQPKGGSTPPPPTGPPTRGPVAPPPVPPKKRRRTGRYVALGVVFLLIAWVVFLVAVPVNAWKNVSKLDASPAGARPSEQPGTTYLLVGSDSRKGLTKKEKKKLGTGGVGVDGGRTDTIMLLHIGSEKPLLLSIPRDSIVPIPGHGTTKINAAFAYGGPKLLVKTIEQNTGVRIDHFVEIGFGGFVNAVDAVNGITICPTRKMVDKRANLNIKKGCQHVDGITALGYARSRHTDPALGDITRAKHQREVVSAIGAKVKSPWTVLNPWRYSSLVNAATSSLRVSEGTGTLDMAHFARAMTKVNGSSGATCSMPIRDLAVHWDTERALALMDLIKTDKTDNIPKNLCLPTGLTS
ncbi:MAG: cell envelope-related transcriptional attenuator [Marmoricola sp.]|nr:cell envelope-related transcriptional attenuator [Marmoricola sp.]